jgi:hypothetical protein
MSKTVPLSFDFGGRALRPEYIIKCSYGNDSIALIQWLYEYDQKHPLGKVVVLYNDTDWAADWWSARVENAEKNLVVKYGFIPARTVGKNWDRMLREHNAWPDKLRRFCTQEQKIIPTINWLCEHDPEGTAELVCGVRREESGDRRNWPEWVDSDSTNEGRAQWSPLVFHTEAMRNELIIRAGWVPLPHRSRECRCVLANSQDIKTWSEADILSIEAREKMLGTFNREREFSNKFMFHPHRKKGNPQGIREVVEWAKQVKQTDAIFEPSGGCDSGYCTG